MNMRFIISVLLLAVSVVAYSDTPPPNTVKAKAWSGDGNTSITATGSSLNVNVTNPGGGTVTATQGTTPWVVGQSTGANLHVDIDNFPSIQPVSQSGVWSVGRTWNLLNTTDSVNAVESGTWNVGLSAGTNLVGSFKLTDGTNTAAVTVSGALKVDGSAVTQPVSGTVTANIGTTNGLALDASVQNVQGSVAGGTAATKSSLAGGVYNSATPTLTNSQQASLQLDSSGNLKTTGSVSGTVTANQGTSPWVVGQITGSNLHTDVDNFPSTQAVTQSGSWTTGRTWSLLNSTDSVNAVESGSWSVTANIGTTNGLALDTSVQNVQGSVAGGTAASKSSLDGGVYNSSAPTLTNGQQASLQLNSSGGLKVDGSAVTQPVSGTVTTVSPDNANATLSARQTVTGTETNLAAPTHAVGVLVECESVNADNLRWGFSNSTTAILSSTLGVLCEPGRDTGYLPLGASTYLHMISTGSGSDYIDVQWVLSQ